MRPKLVICFLLAASTFAVYWPVRNHSFICLDDMDFVAENSEINAGLTWQSLEYAFTTPVLGNWHPVTTLSHILDCQFFGLNPGAHHLVNVAFHIANGLLLFLWLSRLTGATWRSASVAALFALHPLRVESVAWISERKDLLSGLFFLLTLWAYVRYAQVQSPKSKVPSQEATSRDTQHAIRNQQSASPFPLPSFIFYLLSLFFFALGLMSKPMLVTVPFVLLLLDYWPLGRMKKYGLRSKNAESGATLQTSSPCIMHHSYFILLEKLPFLALSLVSCVLTVLAQKLAMQPLATVSVAARVSNALVAYARYLGKTFWPLDLAIPYPYPSHWPLGSVLLAAALLAGVTVAAVVLGRERGERRTPSIQHPAPPRPSPLAPLLVGWLWYLGMLVPVIGLVQVGEQSMADRYSYLPSVGLLVGLVWAVSETFIFFRLPKWFGAALMIPVLGCLAVLNRGYLAQWTDSETLFTHALAVTGTNPGALNNLGVARLAKNKLAEARACFEEALRLDPTDGAARFSLARTRLRQGQPEEALRLLRPALEGRAIHGKLYADMALAFSKAGHQAHAIRFYRKAIEGEPNLVDALNNLAWLLATMPEATQRDGPEAVRCAERACELTRYRRTLLVGTLAAAYAEAGRFSNAVATAQKACALARAAGDTALQQRNQELLELYRAGKPYHERPPPQPAPASTKP